MTVNTGANSLRVQVALALLVCVATAVVRRLVTTSATAMRSDSSLSPRCTSGLEWRMALEGHRSRACRRNSVVLSPAPQSPEQLAASRGMERSMHRKPVAHRSRSSGIRRRPPFCTAVDWSRWRPCPRVSRGRQTELKDYVGISLPHAISPVPFLPVATNAEVPMLVYLLALSVGSRAKRVAPGTYIAFATSSRRTSSTPWRSVKSRASLALRTVKSTSGTGLGRPVS